MPSKKGKKGNQGNLIKKWVQQGSYCQKLLFIILLLSTLSYSQKKSQAERQAILDAKKEMAKIEPREKLNYQTKYCLLLATGKLFTNDVDIRIDYGQDATFFEDTKIRDENGRIIKFNSVMDALNYMDSLGWEFINAYDATIGNQNVYHYLLKLKPGIDFEKIKPKTKKDFLDK